MDRKILEKAKKLQALVERGEMGEALAAKRALDALCLANGLDIETLFNEKKEERCFKLPYSNTYARKLLFQCVHKVLNKDSITYHSINIKLSFLSNLLMLNTLKLKKCMSFIPNNGRKRLSQ